MKRYNIANHDKAKECMEYLKSYCDENRSNCTLMCPFSYTDNMLRVKCILKDRKMTPSEWWENMNGVGE